MSFKGDLSTIGLAEVFQMISMSQKQGTLVVQDTDSRKCIFFGETGVKLLSTGKRRGLRLGDLLIRAGKVSEEALASALERSRVERRLLGEVLVEGGLVSAEDIDELVRSQIEEEIYDLFVWKRAAFEFVEGPPAEAFKDPEGPVTQLSFDVNSLLLEAVRRADEWKLISEKIPSNDSIFVFVSESDRREEDKTAPDRLKRVYRLIDGQTSVAELAEGTSVPRFDVSKALVDLVDRGRIRLLTVHEVMDLAVKRMADGRRDKSLRLYMAAAAQAPREPKVLVGVARILEGEGMGKEAGAQHHRAARLFMEQGDVDRALEHMTKASTLSPEDGEIQLGMFEVHAAAGQLQEGKKLVREMINAALMVPDYLRAQALCDRVVEADPADLDAHVLRARVLHRSNRRKDLDQELGHIRKHLPVDPAEADRILRDLKDVVGAAASALARPRTVRQAPARKAGKGVLVAVLLLLLALVGAAVKYELDARAALAAAGAASRAHFARKEYADARRSLEGFLAGKFRFSLLQPARAREELRTLEELVRRRETEDLAREKARADAVREKMNALLRSLEDEKVRNPSVALRLAEELRALAEAERNAEFREKAEEHRRALTRYVAEAFRLREESDRLEAEGKFREAALRIDSLLIDYANTEPARAARYPLAVRTRPEGVKVTVVRRPPEELGVTGGPTLVLRMKVGESIRLLFDKRGYQSVEREIKDKTLGEVTVELTEKLEAWVKPLGVPVLAEPAVLGDAVYVAASKKLFALAAATQQHRWTEEMEGYIAGAPRASNGRLYLACGSAVCALDPARPAGERIVWKYPASERVTGTPAISPDGQVLYAGTADRALLALNAATGELLWRRELHSEATEDIAAVAGAAVVSCVDGSIVAIKGPGPEGEVWRFRGERRFGPLCAAQGAVYAGSFDGHLYAIDAARGVELWRTRLNAVVAGRPARAGNRVYAAGRDGKLYAADAATGDAFVAHQAQQPAQGSVSAAGPLVFFGSDDQYLYAWDITLNRLRWRFKSKGKIRVGAATDGVRVFIASDENVYAIELDEETRGGR